MKNILKNSLLKGVVSIPLSGESLLTKKGLHVVGCQLREEIFRKFGRSFQIREVDTGSCGACESEIISATNPLYDLQRFGIDFVASPRHADALLVTGPVSKNMVLALQKTYEAMPSPKFVISLGDCALDGGIFKDSYYISGGVKKILTVDLHIPGCPPSPLTIIKSLLSFLSGI